MILHVRSTIEGDIEGDEVNPERVSKMVVGVAIGGEQFRIAAGEPPGLGRDDVAIGGRAIECRIDAVLAHDELHTGRIISRRLESTLLPGYLSTSDRPADDREATPHG